MLQKYQKQSKSSHTVKDFSQEINYQTTRSGGKGGQNVNKVETAVIGSLHIDSSALLTEQQKQLVAGKLGNRITGEGNLQLKSQTYRSQLENKEEVTRRINQLVHEALQTKKIRIPTKQSKAAKERRLDSKKRKSELKSARGKWKSGS